MDLCEACITNGMGMWFGSRNVGPLAKLCMSVSMGKCAHPWCTGVKPSKNDTSYALAVDLWGFFMPVIDSLMHVHACRSAGGNS